MKSMAKDKALSVDGISDIIFKTRTWSRMWKKECRKHGRDHEIKEEEEYFLWEVEDKLAT